MAWVKKMQPSYLKFSNRAHNMEGGGRGCAAVRPRTCIAALSWPFRMWLGFDRTVLGSLQPMKPKAGYVSLSLYFLLVK